MVTLWSLTQEVAGSNTSNLFYKNLSLNSVTKYGEYSNDLAIFATGLIMLANGQMKYKVGNILECKDINNQTVPSAIYIL